MRLPIGIDPREVSRTPVRDVIDAHAADAAGCWEQRARAVRSLRFSLRDLAGLDQRVEAHLDGLRIAGEPGSAAVEEALAGGDPGAIFAAAALALRGDPELAEGRLDAALEASAGQERPLISAFGFSAWAQAGERAERWLASAEPRLVMLGLAAFRVHRRAPADRVLQRAATSSDEVIRGEALRLAGELGLSAWAPRLEDDPAGTPHLRLSWARTQALLHGSGAPGALRALADDDGPEAAEAEQWLVRTLDEAPALELVRDGLQRPERRRRALLTAGAAGYAAVVEDLLPWMEDDATARSAGLAFTLITGTDLALKDLDRETPPEPAGGAEELEPVSEVDEDDDLPWPDPARVRDAWARQRERFRRGRRYLGGHPVERQGLDQVLAEGKQPHRRSAALERALLPGGKGGAPLYDTSKPGIEQAREWLGWP